MIILDIASLNFFFSVYRDAALTHLAIAECIEKAYARNLRPFYPLYVVPLFFPSFEFLFLVVQ